MVDKIERTSKLGYQKWKEPIELFEMLSQKHNIKPDKSIYEDNHRFGEIIRESKHADQLISEIIFYYRIQELLEMDSQKEELTKKLKDLAYLQDINED